MTGQARRLMAVMAQFWPVDLLANLEELELVGGVLRMVQRVSPAASVGPRDILQALGSADLERQGVCLTRSTVELAS